MAKKDDLISCHSYLQRLGLIKRGHGEFYQCYLGPKLNDISREFWCLGEVYLNIQDDSVYIFNPDFISVKPSDNGVSIIDTKSNVQPTHNLIRTAFPYDLRGTSIITPILSNLLAYNTLFETGSDINIYRDNICKGLLFTKDRIRFLLDEYYIFRKLIEKLLLDVIFSKYPPPESRISIIWPEINVDELTSFLR